MPYCLTVKKAAEYFGIGEKAIRQILWNHPELMLWVGRKIMVKRKKFELFIDDAFETES